MASQPQRASIYDRGESCLEGLAKESKPPEVFR
jgi:hypothetical protein